MVAATEWSKLAKQYPELHAIPRRLVHETKRLCLQRQDTLFRVNERPANIFFILSGEVQLVRYSQPGSEVVLQRKSSGFIAESSLNSLSYHCDALATADSDLLAFPLVHFRTALARPQFRDYWIDLLAGEVRRLRAQSERLSLNSTAERILHYLASEGAGGSIILAQSRKAWAAELGISHESLYRTLARLRKAGCIVIDENRLTLVKNTPPPGS